ncbi:MAG TPA: serine hydrolase domain-containing protein [Pseudonocardiaceae bacterium]|nr:serine hydrolase domain-containing protein [Pseudonocardiaceae bacterium]
MVHVEAAPEDVGMSTERLRTVTRLVHGYVDERRYAGTVTLVARHDKVVHLDVYGAADRERGVPIRPDTIFRIYSMTKPIASVALMTLYEEGRFQLDDPVAAYLPEWRDLRVLTDDGPREPARPMTVRDLLTHMSGLVGGNDRSPVGDRYRAMGIGGIDNHAGTLAETVTALADVPLRVDPGTRWIYGISTDIVGRLCEVLSGLPFDRFLEQRICTPLGMADTGFTVCDTDRFSALYTPGDDGGLDLLDDPATTRYAGDRTYLSGSAGLVSTAHDYLRFCRMLTRGGELDGVRILGPRTLRLMTANHLPGNRDLTSFAVSGGETSRKGQGFGLGFGVLLDQTVAQVTGTPGEIFWGGAASTAFFVSPADDLIVIFLTQLRPSSTYPIRRQLRATVYASLLD